MAKRGRPVKRQVRHRAEVRTETSRETTARHTGADRTYTTPNRGFQGGRGEKRQFTQVSKLFESKFKQDTFTGKAQKDKLEALVDRLAQILEDGKAAQFFVNLQGKWGPFLSVTDADEYESKGRGGYSRGGNRGGRSGYQKQESQDSDWGSDGDGDKW